MFTIMRAKVSCSFALKAVGSRQESVQQQDEALAIQLLRRKFAHLGHSQKTARHALCHQASITSSRVSCHTLRDNLAACSDGRCIPAHCLSINHRSRPLCTLLKD